jgi:hypothetical protein
MLDTTTLKNELQARINALTNASTFDQVLDIAIASKKAAAAGVALSRTNLDSQLQRLTNTIGAGSAIEDLIEIAATTTPETGVFPIGHIKKCAFSDEKFLDSNNHEWLLSGLLHSKAGYDQALNNLALRSHGRQVYVASSATQGQVVKSAEDGLGNIVIACGSNTHVIVSHDFGETLEAVPHNLSNKAVTVEYIGGHFVVAGNNSSSIFTSYSSNGGTNFSAQSVARGISAGVADTVRSSSNGVGALFVFQGGAEAVYKTSGTANSAVTLPAAINSYLPLVQFFAGAFYVAGKNIQSYYKTTNNGANFTTHSKPSGVGSVVDEYFISALGRFIWMAQSGSYRGFKYTTDFVTWYDLFDVLPVALREYNRAFASVGIRIYIHVVAGGVVVCSPIGNYFSNNFIEWTVINFSRSAEELAGAGAQYVFCGNLVCGGIDAYTPYSTTLSSSVLKVNYAIPDYIGIHRHGIPQIDTNGYLDYVRIK